MVARKVSSLVATRCECRGVRYFVDHCCAGVEQFDVDELIAGIEARDLMDGFDEGEFNAIVDEL